MIPDPEHVAQLIRDVAATEVLPRFRNLAAHEISEKSPGDIVTVADECAERALEKGLATILPNASIVGEESAAKDPETLRMLDSEDAVWIIDPVDGTQNFANSKDCFAMIVALTVGGETQAGWIYEPVAGRMVWAIKGQGAWESGHRLSLPAPPPINQWRGSLNKRTRERLHSTHGPDSHKIPAEMIRYRCVGVEYADLARGRLHFAQYGGRLKPWDHAAGILIFSEAGGFSALIDRGQPYLAKGDMTSQTLLMAPSKEHWHYLQRLFKAPE